MTLSYRLLHAKESNQHGCQLWVSSSLGKAKVRSKLDKTSFSHAMWARRRRVDGEAGQAVYVSLYAHPMVACAMAVASTMKILTC